MYFYDRDIDCNEAIELSLMNATLSFLGLDIPTVQMELETIMKAEKPEPKVEEPKVEEPKVEEPKVEEVKVMIGDTPIEKPVVKKKATRRRKKKEEPKVEETKVEEPKVEEPSLDLPEEDSEFTDLNMDEPVVLKVFDRDINKQAGFVSSQIVKAYGTDWKKDNKKRAGVTKLLKKLEETLCFNEDDTPSDVVLEIIKRDTISEIRDKEYENR